MARATPDRHRGRIDRAVHIDVVGEHVNDHWGVLVSHVGVVLSHRRVVLNVAHFQTRSFPDNSDLTARIFVVDKGPTRVPQ